MSAVHSFRMFGLTQMCTLLELIFTGCIHISRIKNLAAIHNYIFTNGPVPTIQYFRLMDYQSNQIVMIEFLPLKIKSCKN